jgi:hypothetical protein
VQTQKPFLGSLFPEMLLSDTLVSQILASFLLLMFDSSVLMRKAWVRE